MPGVKKVVQISNGVAVIADNTWSAMEGRKALVIKWDEGKWANVSTPGLRQEWAGLAAKPGMSMRKAGDAAGAFAGAAKKVEAVYEAPYLSHAPMEPLNATVEVRADGCDVWAATQIQSAAQQTAAMITGLPADKMPDPHPVSGRRIRTARRRGLHRRSGGDRQGDVADARKAHLDARR